MHTATFQPPAPLPHTHSRPAIRHTRCPIASPRPRHRYIPTAYLVITRPVSRTLPSSPLLSADHPPELPLSPALLAAQHAAYISAIAAAPGPTTLLSAPEAPDAPDAVFIEDVLLPLPAPSPLVLLPLPGHPSRATESPPLLPFLRTTPHTPLPFPHHLDGGDVLRIHDRIFVGLSTRTAPTAVPALQALLSQNALPFTVVPIPVRDGLHLKSHVTFAGPTAPLTADTPPGFLISSEAPAAATILADIQRALPPLPVVRLSAADAHAANVLFLPGPSGARGGERVLVQTRAPSAVQAVRAMMATCFPQGELVTVDTSEFAKANGALTCMSVVFAA